MRVGFLSAVANCLNRCYYTLFEVAISVVSLQGGVIRSLII